MWTWSECGRRSAKKSRRLGLSAQGGRSGARGASCVEAVRCGVSCETDGRAFGRGACLVQARGSFLSFSVTIWFLLVFLIVVFWAFCIWFWITIWFWEVKKHLDIITKSQPITFSLHLKGVVQNRYLQLRTGGSNFPRLKEQMLKLASYKLFESSVWRRWFCKLLLKGSVLLAIWITK